MPGITGLIASTPFARRTRRPAELRCASTSITVSGRGHIGQRRSIPGFDRPVFAFQVVPKLLKKTPDPFHLAGRNAENGKRLARDRITQVPAVEIGEPQVDIARVDPPQKTVQHFVRIGPALFDIVAGMTAEQTGNVDPEKFVILDRFFLPVIQRSHRIDPAGAADKNLPFILRIEVDQILAGKHILAQPEGPGSVRSPRLP